MLTRDAEEVRRRIEKESYLPLDGMLTQAGDLFLKLHNAAERTAMTLTVPNGTEHSPYWVHLRDWKPKVITAKQGTTEYVEVGSLLDTLNDGQWHLTAAGKNLDFDLDFAVKDAAGQIKPSRLFTNIKGNITLAYDADTRYTRRVRTADEVLIKLVQKLKSQPVEGTAPKRTLIYGTTFDPKPDNAPYTAARDEFIR